MGVRTTIKLNLPVIRRLDEAAKKALVQTAEAIHTDLVQSETMPRDTGRLQNESTFVAYENVDTGEVELVSATPYARRLYFHPEYNFQTTENPNAQGKWLETYVDGEKRDFAEKVFARHYKRLAGT